jgi:hypothetical protein
LAHAPLPTEVGLNFLSFSQLFRTPALVYFSSVAEKSEFL